MDTEVIAAALTSASAVVVASISYLSRRKSKRQLQRAESEMSFRRSAMNFTSFLKEWEETHHEIITLMEETSVDRFLILRAWNGVLEPRWTTAVMQIRQGAQKPISYVHLELDQDYVGRLRDMTLRRTCYYVVSQLPDSMLRSVYEAEGVTASMWAYIDEKDGPNKSKALTYCSFATHDPAGLTLQEQTRCMILAGRLKGISSSFES